MTKHYHLMTVFGVMAYNTPM